MNQRQRYVIHGLKVNLQNPEVLNALFDQDLIARWLRERHPKAHITTITAISARLVVPELVVEAHLNPEGGPQ